jgi:hypothetical protein
MKRIDFLKCLGFAPMGLVLPKALADSGVTRDGFKNHPNPTDEEFNQDGYYFQDGQWVMRIAGVRLPDMCLRDGEITVDRNGRVVKKKWIEPYSDNTRGICVYSKPKLVSDMKLPKKARVCYDYFNHRWRIMDVPDHTRDKMVEFTWAEAPQVAEGASIPIIGYFK